MEEEPAAPRSAAWADIARMPSFRALLVQRRRLGFRLTVLTLVVYLGFFLADALAPAFFGMAIPGFGSVGLLLVFLMFVFAWVVAWYYLREADRVLAPLQDRVRLEAGRPETLT
jgi:uncharacterized membrane protein (DUF485 family)